MLNALEEPIPMVRMVRTTNRRLVQPTVLAIAGQRATVWQQRDFAPAWYKDAKHHAQENDGVDSKRREILSAMCFVESYFYEWVRDLVKNVSPDKVDTYIPPRGRRKGFFQKVDDALVGLHRDGHIITRANPQDADLKQLIDFRNGLVHGSTGRPRSQSTSIPNLQEPGPQELVALSHGWALSTAKAWVLQIHSGTGTTPASYLTS